ncbi:MAG TPA: hypothetical protein DDZ89_06925 [Clostridiales bacterium]|nr:hypothetical protein [Clostridiales bacterium]
MSDIVLELIRTGFKNVVIFLAHGGTDNRVALEGSLKMILKRDPKMRKISISLVSSKDVSKLCRDYFDMEPEHDYHAGLVETSQIMYLRPELVKPDQLEMDDDYTSGMIRRDPDYYAKSEKVIDHDLVIPYSFQRKEVRIGVMGFPDQASAEQG